MAEVSDHSGSTNKFEMLSPDLFNQGEEDSNFKNSSSDIIVTQYEN